MWIVSIDATHMKFSWEYTDPTAMDYQISSGKPHLKRLLEGVFHEHNEIYKKTSSGKLVYRIRISQQGNYDVDCTSPGKVENNWRKTTAKFVYVFVPRNFKAEIYLNGDHIAQIALWMLKSISSFELRGTVEAIIMLFAL